MRWQLTRTWPLYLPLALTQPFHELRKLAKIFRMRVLQKGQVLLRQGDAGAPSEAYQRRRTPRKGSLVGSQKEARTARQRKSGAPQDRASPPNLT